jgi:hypothetical protein
MNDKKHTIRGSPNGQVQGKRSTNMKIIYHPVLLFIPLLFISLIASTSRAQMPPSDSAVPYKSITSQEETTIEKTAAIALRHISQARSDIHRKAFASAKLDLAEATRLMETIRDDLSTATAKNLIRVTRKHLEYEKSQQVLRDLPPIYSSLDSISIYLPTDKAKLHIDRAKEFLARNDKRGAEVELVLADKSLIIIEVELPLLKAQQYIVKAQGYLASKNASKADEALNAAEQSAMNLYTGVHSSIFQAKQNLWLAFLNYSSAKRADSGTYLTQARNYLSKAALIGSTKGKVEANKLSSELVELEKQLAGEGKVAESALKAVWEKSEALTERSAAYLSAGLAGEETTLNGESNLIEAKLHVTYAETYQVTTSDQEKAIKELDKAYFYLQQAERSSLAGSADSKKMRVISKIILILMANPENNDFAVQERYDTVKELLSELIQKM